MSLNTLPTLLFIIIIIIIIIIIYLFIYLFIYFFVEPGLICILFHFTSLYACIFHPTLPGIPLLNFELSSMSSILKSKKENILKKTKTKTKKKKTN